MKDGKERAADGVAYCFAFCMHIYYSEKIKFKNKTYALIISNNIIKERKSERS